MKIAVTNYCGTVGKTTIAAHLLSPRMNNAPVLAIEFGERDRRRARGRDYELPAFSMLDNLAGMAHAAAQQALFGRVE